MEWAKYLQTKAGVKLNLAVKYHGDEHLYPAKSKVTSARCHDVYEMLHLIDLSKGILNVFDRGYAD